jgi:hypothetical protein
MCFYTNDYVFCPVCPPVFRKSKPDQQVGPHLECVVSNYSGCMVDFGECPECGKRFQVSYKVDEVIELK